MGRALVVSALILASSACYRGEQIINSDSGLYKAFLTIEEHTEGHRIWVVNISGCPENADLILAMEDYPAYQMSYIEWDDQDRLWFYSSDDGRYYYWELSDSEWIMCSWSKAGTSEVHPPAGLGSD